MAKNQNLLEKNFKYCTYITSLESHSENINTGSYIAGLFEAKISTSIILWGVNLQSLVGYGRLKKNQAIMIVIPNFQLSVIVGLILSDGWLSYPTKQSVNVRLGFEQSINKFEYFWIVFTILSPYCGSYPSLKRRVRLEKISYNISIQTRALPCFTELYTIFYMNSIKIIPDNIYELINPVVLAHWISGDGQVASNGLRLCTDSYSVSEVVKLINVLIIKYRLKCSLNIIGNKPRIYISATSMGLLMSIVKPYIEKSMYYKLESINKVKRYKLFNKNIIDLNTKLNKPKHQRTYSTISNYSLNEPFNYDFLSSYLAGYFEGRGHIWIQKHKGSKTHNPRFCITFSLKNEALAKKLLEIIDSGFIRYKPKDNACVLVVSPVIGLKKIVKLLNGELRTPKIHQFYSLIDWLNKNHSTNINKLPLKTDNLENSSWLSGFVDADGSFSVQYSKPALPARVSEEKGAKKRKISCRLRIEQRILDPITNESYFDILNQISLYLNCKLLTRTQKSTNNIYYTLTASSKVSLGIIIKYFNKHPLYSSKYLDYKDWEKVAYLIINNQHLFQEGINTVEFVRSQINNKRKEFSWYHLKGLG